MLVPPWGKYIVFDFSLHPGFNFISNCFITEGFSTLPFRKIKSLANHRPIFESLRQMDNKFLATEWIVHLEKKHPRLAKKLGIDELIRFTLLAAEVHHRADSALALNSESDTVIPFFKEALKLDIPTADYQALWRTTYPHLSDFRLKPHSLIRKHGRSPQISKKLPEFFFAPPVSTCLLCGQFILFLISEWGKCSNM